MTIPKSYEALAADLDSEKILSKTLQDQKETYMMLADERKVQLVALMEELESIKASVDGYDSPEHAAQVADELVHQCNVLQQRLTVAERRESEAREELLDLSRKLDVFYSRSHGIKNLSAIEDANDKSKALQQRLTVAEQRSKKFEGLLLRTNELLYAIQGDPGSVPSSSIDAMRGEVFTALKPAEGEGS